MKGDAAVAALQSVPATVEADAAGRSGLQHGLGPGPFAGVPVVHSGLDRWKHDDSFTRGRGLHQGVHRFECSGDSGHVP